MLGHLPQLPADGDRDPSHSLPEALTGRSCSEHSRPLWKPENEQVKGAGGLEPVSQLGVPRELSGGPPGPLSPPGLHVCGTGNAGPQRGPQGDDSTELPPGGEASLPVWPCAPSALASTHLRLAPGTHTASKVKKPVASEAEPAHQLLSEGAGVKVRPACPTARPDLPGTVTFQTGPLPIWGPDVEMGVLITQSCRWPRDGDGSHRGGGGSLPPGGTFGSVWRHFGLSQPEVGGVCYQHLAGDGQRRCQISYEAQDGPRRKELSSPKRPLC